MGLLQLLMILLEILILSFYLFELLSASQEKSHILEITVDAVLVF
jgi:hypothetical protein